MTDESISIKQYFDREIASLKDIIDTRFKLSQIAIDKAEEAQKLRNENQNEWRNQNKDERSNLATTVMVDALRNEVLTSLNHITDDIRSLRENRANMEGRFWAIGVGLTILNIALSVILKFLR